MAQVEAPFPPGTYDVVVVGSGPGGLQTSYALSRLGVEHAVLSADEAPGGMFRKWPMFQRLISSSKLDAPPPRETREYEWYDQNSLVAEEPALRALVPAEMGRQFFPTRAEMEAGLSAFADRARLRVRYGCAWEATRREDGEVVLTTADGDYRCRAALFALGVTEPWKSAIPGIEHVPHYADAGEPKRYEGRRVFVIGKRNSGFEIADALLPWASQVVLASPRPVQSAVLASASVSARYFQPLEDFSRGGGTVVLDASVERVEPTPAGGFRVSVTGTTRPGAMTLEADAAIAATGFRAPLRDLPEVGVATVDQGRIPALTPFWESVGAPGIFFAGNASQGAPGLRKHGMGSTSTAVRGFRYNARILARHLAESRLGFPVERPRLRLDEVAPLLTGELARAPELWSQKGYLAHAVTLDPNAGIRDEGIVPLAHFVGEQHPDAAAAAVEIDPAGTIYPAVYVRRDGRLYEHELDPHPLNAFDGAEYRRALETLLGLRGA
jgi:thioredoxin reductase